jgi:hypothetical protein
MTLLSRNFKTAAVGTVFGGSLLFTAGLGVAGAEPPPPPPPASDGLVSITQGETAVADGVATDEAAAVVAQLCGAGAPNALGLAQQVDTEGGSLVACAGLPAGDVVIMQNGGAAESPVFPEQGPAQPGVDPAQEPAADVPPGSTEGGVPSQVPAPTADPDFGIGGDQQVDEDEGLDTDDEQ